MIATLRQEIEKIIKDSNPNCLIDDFANKVNWAWISERQQLSEQFIEKYQDKVDWGLISRFQQLSEQFIEKYQDKVSWDWISRCQQLSEQFIEKYQDRVDWVGISACQQLSEQFIEKFKDKVNWYLISRFQQLSEQFIEKYADKVNLYYISECQQLSEQLIEKFKNKIDINTYKEVHREITKEEKIKEMQEYAKKHNLKFDGEYLYAFRNHDKWGRGTSDKKISYKKEKYYHDWHCDMRIDVSDSFGLGIWPMGNTPVRVKVDDWGCCVNREDGKCRVWGFEAI